LSVAAVVAHAGGTEPAADERRAHAFRSTVAAADEETTRRGSESFAVELIDARIRRESERLGERSLAPVSPLLAKDPRFAKSLRQLANNLELGDPRFQTVAPFVVGGSPIPSAVDLVALSEDAGFRGAFCSGTLIAARRVLTAAHCVCNGAANFVYAGESIGTSQATSIRVERANFVDRGFRCPTEPRPGMDLEQTVEFDTRGKDLAVLEIESRPARVRPRPLLSEAAFEQWRAGPYGYFVRAVGYGFTATPVGGSSPSHGRRLYADIAVARARCGTGDSSFGCEPGVELVAQGHPAHHRQGARPDTCGGDSGGPIYALRKEGAEKNFYLIGVTSRGIDDRCGSGGIYGLTVPAATTAWLKRNGASVATQ
jgi:hypothetical protein